MVLGRILVVSRQIEIQQLARSVAREVLVADDATEAIDIIASAIVGASPDLVIFDSVVGPAEIKSFLTTTGNNPAVPIVIVGQSESKPPWLVQFPQFHYISFENGLDRLRLIIDGKSGPAPFAAGNENLQAANDIFFADELANSVSMAGKSRAVEHTLKMTRLVAESNCNPVLITGETGTGKELIAKAVHFLRHPKEQFVAVNCAALTANLLESELFGHVKGSFTSADKDKTGLLELAGEGTVFLDEISEIPLELQAKLLRILQEKTFRKVGGIADIGFKATIIASSNRDLRREVRENRFRPDLYYRLNICPINIAPLRDQHRKQDIRLLANYFLKTSTISPAKIGKITSFTELAMQKIEQHCWPGNVRELRNVVERAILLETTEKIGLSSIHIEPLESDDQITEDIERMTEDPSSPRFAEAGAGQMIEDSNPVSEVSGFSLEKAERELIARALQESGWQKTRAAALLGITRATLYAKVKQHNIQRGIYVPQPCFK
ncbi:MAG: sigma-54 dependent transcriptional regulator [Sedimentisphaerales bacterium]